LVGVYLPSDVGARFRRAKGYDVLFVSGSDEYGTPIVVGAAKEGLTIEAYSDKYRALHKQLMKDFNISFDYYGRTHTEKHTKLVQGVFEAMDARGLIEERIMIQPFSISDNMFLADRFIEGTCPKCGYEKARGDQCDKCNALMDPKDLINPYSTISGTRDIEMRETKHLFFLASRATEDLREWINSRQGWPKTAMAIANKWLDEGLQDRSITRDMTWGVPVPRPGYENKVFYVWFDAPWGYVSMSQYARENWADWWKNDDAKYVQFMGKDNVPFHAVFFPSQELAANEGWKTVDILKAMNFLNFEGAKVSKSTGNGIFLDQALDDAPADCWRYALLASAPETDDTDFTIQRFADIVNKDLNGMLGNFVSRVTKITEKSFGSKIPKPSVISRQSSESERALNDRLSELTNALENYEFRKAITALRSMWAIGNEYFTEKEPWALIKDGDMDAAGAVLNECFQMIDFFAQVSTPFIPNTAEKMCNIFVGAHDCAQGVCNTPLQWPSFYDRRIADGTEFIVPENLFERIDDDKIASMTAKYVKK
jgi:methionyl-tRNA synthetase